jgi:hypothetical protein
MKYIISKIIFQRDNKAQSIIFLLLRLLIRECIYKALLIKRIDLFIEEISALLYEIIFFFNIFLCLVNRRKASYYK